MSNAAQLDPDTTDRRLRMVEADTEGLRGVVMFVAGKVQDVANSNASLNRDFTAFFAEWRTFRTEWKAEVDAAREASTRESKTNEAQEARLTRLEAAAKQITAGAERAEQAAPAMNSVADRLHQIAVPPPGATLRQWATFALVLLVTLWEVGKSAGVIK